ncbi:hypothetical protein AAFC00_002187 [Neodothiora populina]|uniref:rRNA-processing protein FYV7 n=1 Tax=Neodothiora populina TaxID=2781224 RepID=A0ABR3PGK2_9PEZI
MAVTKRSRDESAPDSAAKKQKRGFTVGPANLPDGTWKRKTQQIKKDLIVKAKLRKEYAKVKAREEPNLTGKRSLYDDDDENDDEPPTTTTHKDGDNDTTQVPEQAPATIERHPDRVQMIEETPEEALQDAEQNAEQTGEQAFRQRRQRKPKPIPFAREHAEAQQRKQEAEERRLAREQAQRERAQKLEERERFRKAMAKARTGGKNGQRKLGRESTVLLEKVKRMVGQT